MEKSGESGVVTVRLFGFLGTLMREKGFFLPSEQRVPREGRTGLEIAVEMGLPVEKVEAVFRNGRIQNLEEKVYPGDRVAFVPRGTPGPYRVLLGMVGVKKPPRP